MSRHLPLIRASVIFPIRRWLEKNGYSVSERLYAANLEWVPPDDPTVAIPLLDAVTLLQNIARDVGPDAPFRMIDQRSVLAIGLITGAVSRATTLGDSFHNIAKSMHTHCTHESLMVAEHDEVLHISEGWSSRLGEDESLHLIQQFTAAMVMSICELAGVRDAIKSVSLVPHPETGLKHLKPWLDKRVYSNERRVLDIEISLSLANKPISLSDASFTDVAEEESLPALCDATMLCDAVSTLLSGMLPSCRPTVEHIAKASRLSPRTLQRRLNEEGSSFSELLDKARAQYAIGQLSLDRPPPLLILTDELGYTKQETLTRAVQRWTGKTPSHLKRQTALQ